MNWTWEDERKQRGRQIELIYRPVLEAGTKISVSWDGGGDDCIMSVSYDGKEQENYEQHSDFLNFVAEILQIPSVGESFMKGTGRLFIDDSLVKIEHKSHCTGASWDHIDMDHPDFDPHQFDWDANMKDIDEERAGIDVLFE